MTELATVELKFPIKAHGEEKSTLTFRRMNMGDLIKLDAVNGEMGKTAKLIELLAAIPPSSVNQIDAEDLAAINGALAPLLEAFQPTGGSAQSD